MAYVLLYLKL